MTEQTTKVEKKRQHRDTKLMLLHSGFDGLVSVDVPDGITATAKAVAWVRSQPPELAAYGPEQSYMLVRSIGLIKQEVETRHTVSLEEI